MESVKTLPANYSWLSREGSPAMLVEAIKHYGVLEHKGVGSNPDITAWAKEVGVSGWYTDDSVPWCGLFVGMVAKRCGYPQPAAKLLSAISWATWGQEVPKERAMLWDVLVFSRTGGGHVAFYVGESPTAYLCFGGNQSDSVSFTWVAKNRCVAVRRPVYKVGEPKNIRKIYLTQDGELSKNEA